MKKFDRDYRYLSEVLGLRARQKGLPESHYYFLSGDFSSHLHDGYRHLDGAHASHFLKVTSSMPGKKIRKTTYLVQPNPFGYQLLGAFRPLQKMAKDLSDTFRPYHSQGKVIRNTLQLFRGIGNIGKGVFNILGGAVAIALSALWFVSWIIALPLWFKPAKRLKPAVVATRGLSWIIEGSLNTVRGALQIVTAPLTLLLKMPLRGIITHFSKPKLFEEKKSVQKIRNHIQALIDPSQSAHNAVVKAATEMRTEHQVGAGFSQGDIDRLTQRQRQARQVSNYIGTLGILCYELERKHQKSIRDGWQARNRTHPQSYRATIESFKEMRKITSGLGINHSGFFHQSNPYQAIHKSQAQYNDKRGGTPELDQATQAVNRYISQYALPETTPLLR